jgi:hypothetical protein
MSIAVKRFSECKFLRKKDKFSLLSANSRLFGASAGVIGVAKMLNCRYIVSEIRKNVR